MKNTGVARAVCSLLSVILGCAFLRADTGAPQFLARTLDGQTFTNGSLRGSVVLLQFWTTWCPVCRGDQPAVDNIQAAFGGRGLVVIAIDDGEPEATVRSYLQHNPRSCPVVVQDGHSLAARFGVHSYPHYVVLDRQGNIAASASGGGGEAYLRHLLSRAGMSSNPDAPAATFARQASASTNTGGPRWITAPSGQTIVPSKPPQKTIFLFANGERLEAEHYMLRAGFMLVTVDGQERKIPYSALDMKQTQALNRQRGINLTFPTRANELFLGF